MNQLGTREPAQHGSTTLPEVEPMCRAVGEHLGQGPSSASSFERTLGRNDQRIGVRKCPMRWCLVCR